MYIYIYIYDLFLLPIVFEIENYTELRGPLDIHLTAWMFAALRMLSKFHARTMGCIRNPFTFVDLQTFLPRLLALDAPESMEATPRIKTKEIYCLDSSSLPRFGHGPPGTIPGSQNALGWLRLSWVYGGAFIPAAAGKVSQVVPRVCVAKPLMKSLPGLGEPLATVLSSGDALV